MTLKRTARDKRLANAQTSSSKWRSEQFSGAAYNCLVSSETWLELDGRLSVSAMAGDMEGKDTVANGEYRWSLG